MWECIDFSLILYFLFAFGLPTDYQSCLSDLSNPVPKGKEPSNVQIEGDLQLARLVAGLHGTRARPEVSERASAVMEAGLQLAQDQDKLTAMMEAAQVIILETQTKIPSPPST